MKTIIKNTAILLIITIVSGFLLGFVNDLTKESISTRDREAKESALTEVVGDEYSVNLDELMDTYKDGSIEITEAYPVTNSKNEYKGIVMVVTTEEGYNGTIKLCLGVLVSDTDDSKGKISGLQFLELNETAGLGMNAKDTDFTDQFKGKDSNNIILSGQEESDNQIDAISGATITSNAIKNAVNTGLKYYTEHFDKEGLK